MSNKHDTSAGRISVDSQSTIGVHNEVDRFTQDFDKFSLKHGSMSKITPNIDILSSERWYIQKMREEYDEDIVDYYETQIQSITKFQRDIQLKIDSMIAKIVNTMKWSSAFTDPFQNLIIEYVNYVITEATSKDKKCFEKFQKQLHEPMTEKEEGNKTSHSVVNKSTLSTNRLQKWHEKKHEEWLQEQRVKEEKLNAKELRGEAYGIHPSEQDSNELATSTLVIGVGFSEKTKLEAWFNHYIGTKLEKKIEEIKSYIMRLQGLLSLKTSNSLRIEQDTLNTIEKMIIRKESDIRWTAEAAHKDYLKNVKSAIYSKGLSTKARSYQSSSSYVNSASTSIRCAKDKYWCIWFLAANGLYEQLSRYLSKPNRTNEINARDPDFGMTALHYASKKKKVECVKVLLERGADVHVKTPDGRTALHLAAAYCSSQGSREMMLDLLSYGNIDYYLMKDNYGLSALDLALQNQNKTAIQVLQNWSDLSTKDVIKRDNTSSGADTDDLISCEASTDQQ